MVSDTDPSGLLAMSIVFVPLLVLVVALRFYARAFFNSSLEIDDWLMVPALGLTLGMCIIGIVGTRKHALGYPTPGVGDPASSELSESPEEALVGKLLWALQLIGVLALCSIKLGALFFYRRIFCSHDRSGFFSVLTWILIGAVIVWTVLIFIFIFFQCDAAHVSGLWTSEANFIRYCSRTPNFDIGFSSSDFVTDVLIIFLPIPKVWLIHASKGRKFAVSAVFGLAFIGHHMLRKRYSPSCYGLIWTGSGRPFLSFTRKLLYLTFGYLGSAINRLTVGSGLTASAVRMASFIRLERFYKLGIKLDPDLDQTVNVFWSILEASISLIAVNLPALWGLFSKILPKKLLHTARSLFSHSSSQPRSSAVRYWPTHGDKEKENNSMSSESRIVLESAFVRTEVDVYTGATDVESQTHRSFFEFPTPYLPPITTGSRLTLATPQG